MPQAPFVDQFTSVPGCEDTWEELSGTYGRALSSPALSMVIPGAIYIVKVPFKHEPVSPHECKLVPLTL